MFHIIKWYSVKYRDSLPGPDNRGSFQHTLFFNPLPCTCNFYTFDQQPLAILIRTTKIFKNITTINLIIFGRFFLFVYWLIKFSARNQKKIRLFVKNCSLVAKLHVFLRLLFFIAYFTVFLFLFNKCKFNIKYFTFIYIIYFTHIESPKTWFHYAD